MFQTILDERTFLEGVRLLPPGSRSLLGVRLFTYRRALRCLGAWLRSACALRPDALTRELDLADALRRLSGELRAGRNRRRRPAAPRKRKG